MIKLLANLANELDKCGFLAEADQVDAIIKSAIEWNRMTDWVRKQYDRLKRLFSKKKTSPVAAKEYDAAAANRLDDIIRKKQSGPPEERLYIWFCNRFPNSCSPCNERHGRVRTLRQWRTEGMPGPFICQKDCACRLVELGPGGTLQADDAALPVGLRENGTGPNMNQGFVLEPFYSNYGHLQ